MDMIITKELAYEFEMPSPVRVYKDGSVERIPSPNPDPETGVSSKDITISENPPVSARLYLPNLSTHQHYPNPKLPIFVYFHGGGFITGSAFSSLYHRYLNILVSQAGVVVVSVEYRLAPENPLPAAYEDCWTALQWVASHTIGNKPDKESDPWLLNYGDFGRIFIGGDSSGGNIAHNVAMRAGVEDLKGGVKIFGALVGYPFFWGSKPNGSEPTADREKYWATLVWDLVYPTAPGGIDNPIINPFGFGKPSLATLGCSKMLVYVAEKEPLRDREILYSNEVKESGWGGEMGLFEAEGEHHLFHILNPESDNAKILMKRLVLFFLD